MKRFRNELRFDGFTVVHGQSPGGERERSSVTAPNSIDIAFLPHVRSVVRRANGRYEERSFRVGQGGTHGIEPIEFIDVDGPSDYIEVQLSERFLSGVGDALGAANTHTLPERHDIVDPVYWAVGVRLRAHALNGWSLEEPEAHEAVTTLLNHLLVGYLGANHRRTTRLAMDTARLKRVHDFINASLRAKLTIKEMADVAAVSPFHFIRAFKAATGLTPHEYVLSRRMERVRQGIQISGLSVAEAARSVGYQNAHHFRCAFQRYFGVTPSTLSS